MVKRNCLYCKKEFLTKNSPSRKGRGKFCSRLCKTSSFRGKRLSPKSEFKKNFTPWNKGFIGFGDIAGFRVHGAKPNTGRTRFKPGENKDEKNSMWKGDKVGYGALHDWVKKRLGQPAKCEHCQKENLTGRNIHWANKSRKYHRDISDWLRLCAKCHKAYDCR